MTSAAAQTKEDANYLKAVREQYENYPYPYVDPKGEHVAIRIPVAEWFGCMNHYCYSGRKDFRKEFRALVAGGGTGDATIALAEQLRGTGNEVVYVDMSEASMKVAQERASIRGLTNIRWIRDSLLNIPKLGLGQFDYINCSGVLHHLADPDAGLSILNGALKDDGAMAIMLYAKYGRMAVYMMQETLRMINRNEPNLQKQVDNAKAVLGNLPQTNWLFNSSQMILDEIQKGGDVGIYDLLLHTQDRSYSIPELYDFCKKSELNILRFFSDYQNISHQIYNPAFYLNDETLVRKVGNQPAQKQQELAELLHGKIEKHCFYAVKKLPAQPAIHDLEMIPILGLGIATDHSAITRNIAQKEQAIQLYQESTNTRVIAPNGPHLGAMWEHVDGKKTLREIYGAVLANNKDADVTIETLAMQFIPFYEALNRVDWMLLRHQSTAPVKYHEGLQENVSRK